MKRRILDNDFFVGANLEKLVEKYSHQKIIISRGEVFTGTDAVRRARHKYPNTIPMFLPVPGPEEFNHIL